MEFSPSRRAVLTGMMGGVAAAALWRSPAHAEPIPGGGYSAEGPVEILSEESTCAGAKVRLGAGGVWTLRQEDLSPLTEYTLTFRAKATGPLAFRLSGFKNPEILDYLNGTGDLNAWESDPAGRDKLNQ